jgi:ABC-2 type transport system ATP-binding protein
VAGDGTAFTDSTGALHAELARRGLSARPFQRGLLVPLGDDRTYDVVRDAVAALGLPLSRLERRRHQVEEIFRDGQPDYAGRDQAMEAVDAY